MTGAFLVLSIGPAITSATCVSGRRGDRCDSRNNSVTATSYTATEMAGETTQKPALGQQATTGSLWEEEGWRGGEGGGFGGRTIGGLFFLLSPVRLRPK